MTPQTYIEIALLSYFLGSIPFGYILVRTFKKEDIRAMGSGNIGATNVARSGAKGLAAATLLLDALKGSAAVLLAARLAENNNGIAPAFAAFCVIAGHCFPVWLRFRGGKGVATALGAFIFLTPKALALGLCIFLITVAVTRYVSLGSVLGAITIPVASAFFTNLPKAAMGLLSAACLVIIVKHGQNIRRLMAGTESKFGAPKA